MSLMFNECFELFRRFKKDVGRPSLSSVAKIL
jgi:hypothetical protein